MKGLKPAIVSSLGFVILAFTFLSLHFFSGISGCAHRLPPPGGPADSLAPEIIAVYPKPGATNQSQDLKVIFAFSEWMEAGLKRNQFLISPSLPRKLHIEHKGDRVEITSNSELEENTTYILTLLPGAADMKGNEMEKGFQLAFSTGSQIDSTRLSGKIISPDLVTPSPAQKRNFFAALYPLGSRRDTLNYLTIRKWGKIEPDSSPVPGRERPMYVIPADSMRFYSMEGVEIGSYSMLTFSDVNKNALPDIGIELLGVGPESLFINGEDTAPPLLPTSVDTLPIGMLVAEWQAYPQTHQIKKRTRNKQDPDSSQGVIYLRFSKSIKPPSLTEGEVFSILDEQTGEKFPIKGFHPYPESLSVYELLTPRLKLEKRYNLLLDSALAINGKKVTSDTIRFTTDSDTTTQKRDLSPIDPLAPRGGLGRVVNSNFYLKDHIDLHWTGIMDSSIVDSLQKNLRVELDSVEIEVEFQPLDFRTLRLKFQPLVFNGSSLHFKSMRKAKKADKTQAEKAQTDTLTVDSAAGDSLVAIPLFSVQLPDSSLFANLELDAKPSVAGWKAELKQIENGRTFKKDLNSGKQMIKDLPAGNYRLGIWHDENQDTFWNPGTLIPWKRQESRFLWADTIELQQNKTTVFPHTLAWPPNR